MTSEPVIDVCGCVRIGTGSRQQRAPRFHRERQDTSAPGWLRLLELVEEAAADGREEFRPLIELTAEQRRQVVTLPAGIAKLKAVKHLNLYGSNLVRVPPEIGQMDALEEFTPYTSYRLHWFPYEITRCPNLRRSTVSTRAVYGNYSYRPAFPQLSTAPTAAGLDLGDLDPGMWGVTAVRGCSVCDRVFAAVELRQVWISLRVSGLDVMPLLVNACSQVCIDALPQAPSGYVPHSHTGGMSLVQPPTSFSPPRTPRTPRTP